MDYIHSMTLFQNAKQSLTRFLRVMLVLLYSVLWSNHLVKVEIHVVGIFQLVCICMYILTFACFLAFFLRQGLTVVQADLMASNSGHF